MIKNNSLSKALVLAVTLFISSSNSFFALSQPPAASNLTSLEETSSYSNPATLSRINSSLVSFAYMPSVFGLAELSPAYIFIGHPIGENIVIAANAEGLYAELFRELSAWVGASLKITDDFAAGLSVQIDNQSIKNYSEQTLIKFNLGAVAHLSDNLQLAAAFLNCGRAYYDGGEKNARQNLMLGLSYSPFENLYSDINTYILLGNGTGVSLAVRYDLWDMIAVRLAAATLPRTFEGGVRTLIWDTVGITYSLYYHDILGYGQKAELSIYW